MRIWSIRTKLQAAFAALALTAIGVSSWVAAAGAGAALRQAAADRLTVVRQTRSEALERYFRDLRRHVVTLAASESTAAALEQFQRAWHSLPPTGGPAGNLRPLYPGRAWFPADPRTRTLQLIFLAANPHPPGAKDLLVSAARGGDYGAVHARHHPQFHRYQNAFGFYDLFLISAPEGRILYTVMKEIDLGFLLTEPPYDATKLAEAFRAANRGGEDAAITDYAPYVASGFAPAAFVAAPVLRAGAAIGVLAIQISIQEVNRVMTAEGRWREEGLGETGQAYVVGSDSRLRSDFRPEVEHFDEFLRQLREAGYPADVMDTIRRNGTAVLALPLPPQNPSGGAGRNYRGVPVLRSQAPLNVPGLDWTLYAEIDVDEALAGAAGLRRRVWAAGVLIALLFFGIANWLGLSLARPILALAAAARRLGTGELGMKVPVESRDEIGELASAFNAMSDNLRRTTVSREKLQALAGRLIHAQEDERARVGRELHDDVVQRLAAAAIEAGRLAKAPALDGATRAGLERLKARIGAVTEDVHGVSRRLHPAMLEELGLEAAVESEVRAFVERGGPPVDLDLAAADLEGVPADLQLTLFRLVQEGLRNIQRHAAAAAVTLRLRRAGAGIVLEIGDDGRGFDRGAPDFRPGLGLASMEERTRLAGGAFEIDSRPGAGTRIRARFGLDTRGRDA
jgi:methyl-accepting chemotaxis protein